MCDCSSKEHCGECLYNKIIALLNKLSSNWTQASAINTQHTRRSIECAIVLFGKKSKFSNFSLEEEEFAQRILAMLPIRIQDASKSPALGYLISSRCTS